MSEGWRDRQSDNSLTLHTRRIGTRNRTLALSPELMSAYYGREPDQAATTKRAQASSRERALEKQLQEIHEEKERRRGARRGANTRAPLTRLSHSVSAPLAASEVGGAQKLTHTHLPLCVCAHAFIHVCVHSCMYICRYADAYVDVYVYVYVYVYVHVHVIMCICIRICIPICTCIQAQRVEASRAIAHGQRARRCAYSLYMQKIR